MAPVSGYGAGIRAGACKSGGAAPRTAVRAVPDTSTLTAPVWAVHVQCQLVEGCQKATEGAPAPRERGGAYCPCVILVLWLAGNKGKQTRAAMYVLVVGSVPATCRGAFAACLGMRTSQGNRPCSETRH